MRAWLYRRAACCHRGAFSCRRTHPLRPQSLLYATALWRDDVGDGAKHHDGDRLASEHRCRACLVRRTAGYAIAPLASTDGPYHPSCADRIIPRTTSVFLIDQGSKCISTTRRPSSWQARKSPPSQHRSKTDPKQIAWHFVSSMGRLGIVKRRMGKSRFCSSPVARRSGG